VPGAVHDVQMRPASISSRMPSLSALRDLGVNGIYRLRVSSCFEIGLLFR